VEIQHRHPWIVGAESTDRVAILLRESVLLSERTLMNIRHQASRVGHRGFAVRVAWLVVCAAGLGASGACSSPSSAGDADQRDPSASTDQAAVATGPSGLPTPPGVANVPKPSGAVGGLTVLNWAGFKGAATFTFDDSQPSQLAHFAELEAVGVPMTFYISTGESSQANYDATFSRAVKDGDEIGNHTVHHCHANLTGCSFGSPLSSVGAELDQCDAFIPAHTGQATVWTGASPFGDTGYDASAKSRFFLYRGVGAGMVAPNDNTDPFNLPIHLAASGETASSFNNFTNTAQSSGKWVIFLFHTITPTTAIFFNPVAITDVTGAMSHAKALGNVWVDSLVHIGAYWLGQKIVSSAPSTTSGKSQTLRWTLPAHFPSGRFVRVKVSGGTLSQAGTVLTWNAHGYYEVSLDAGTLTLSP
jgi:peptidoglycan/xylan/chitin deacetylase (PgdA/CDA1 family)